MQLRGRDKGRNDLIDLIQSASNAVASTVSAPVDLIAAGLRKAGVQGLEEPFLGSKHMERLGLTRPVQPSMASVIGETAGGVLPAAVAVASRAPDIAQSMTKHGRQFQQYNQALGPAGASHVVTARGVPVAEVGLHGTRSKPFAKVSFDEAADSPYGNFSPEDGVFWFTNDTGHAVGYAGGAKGSVLELDANLRNPMVVDAMAEAKRIGRQIGVEVNDWDDAKSVLQYADWVWDKVRLAKNSGHDSLIVKNVADAPGTSPKNLQTHFAVFDENAVSMRPYEAPLPYSASADEVAKRMQQAAAKQKANQELAKNIAAMKP